MKIHRKKSQEGQVLLIIIMLLATIITVVTTVSFRSTTETQINKLEEESQKTLAAAEAGIEKAIAAKVASGNSQKFNDPSDPNNLNMQNLSGIDLANSSVNVTSNTGRDFVTPLIQKDQQYTFYLSNYNNAASPPFSSPYPNQITVYYGSESGCTTLALEITRVSGLSAPYTVSRYISDVGGGIVTNPAGSGTNNVQGGSGATIGNVIFNCRTTGIPWTANTILMIVRTLGNTAAEGRTKLAIRGSSAVLSLPPQGKYIVSEAKSQSGVIKKIQLFQSLPQIPAEFFVSTF